MPPIIDLTSARTNPISMAYTTYHWTTDASRFKSLIQGEKTELAYSGSSHIPTLAINHITFLSEPIRQSLAGRAIEANQESHQSPPRSISLSNQDAIARNRLQQARIFMFILTLIGLGWRQQIDLRLRRDARWRINCLVLTTTSQRGNLLDILRVRWTSECYQTSLSPHTVPRRGVSLSKPTS
jgi:hypothetical protein